MNNFIRNICAAGAILAGIILATGTLFAAPFDNLLSRDGTIRSVDSSADTYEYIGSNVIARGHVVILADQDLLLTADKAIFNLDSQDVELSGKVSFSMRRKRIVNMTFADYEKAVRDPYVIVKRLQTKTLPTGQKMIRAEVTDNAMYMNADKAFMNFKTGTIQFKNFMVKSDMLYAQGERAERFYDGSMNVQNAKFTTCNYLVDGHDHYAVSVKKAVIKPPRQNSGLLNYKFDQGDVSVLGVNSFLELWGVPVFWLPVVYKPAEAGGFGGRIAIGNSSDWGYFIQTSKNFKVLDDPYLNVNVMLDLFEERGFGYGVNVDFMTPESSTSLFFYGIDDDDPYAHWGNDDKDDADWKKNNSRLKVPSYRYEFRISNLTHLSPRTDFRGQLDVISDYNFLYDYFDDRYEEVLEPSSFIDLERQFDRMTATLYTTFRVNDFSTTLERLPEIRFDFQRQHLFGGLYYQGETSFGYYQMKWRDFDRERIYGNMVEMKDYESFRFDSLHMFYYPIKFWNINFIPRAGFRLTAYSDSSKRKITTDDLNNMFIADSVDGQPRVDVVNYDDKGGDRFRFAGEIGFELNTKFYRTWQNVKSEYFGLDGLRHVAIPYINYTFIPEPTETPEHLYYFDEVDRIDENHFIRLGLLNRLQTRRNGEIYEWLSLETYWDYYIHDAEGMDNVGDLGVVLRFNPTKDLSITSLLLMDLGKSNDHDTEVWRGDRKAGRPGLDSDLFNRWYINASWRFAPRWRVFASYQYVDDYLQRTPYSMGTSMAGISASSIFFSRSTRGQHIGGGLEFPLFDDKTSGYFALSYDVDAALMENMSIGIRRKFHCWQLHAEFGRECERRGDDYKKEYSHYIAIFVSLTAMPGVEFGHKVED